MALACLHHLSAPQTLTSSSSRREEVTTALPALEGCEKRCIKAPCPGASAGRDVEVPLAGVSVLTSLPACVTALCLPAFLSHYYIRLFFRLIIASHTARKEIFLCNKNSFGVFYSLLIHAKQESRHVAFYGYERSRPRFLMFLDNCVHNIIPTLS